jgi:hypothetical protein
MENHHFEWENKLDMAIFNSYVKLPEGNKMTIYNFKFKNNDVTVYISQFTIHVCHAIPCYFILNEHV